MESQAFLEYVPPPHLYFCFLLDFLRLTVLKLGLPEPVATRQPQDSSVAGQPATLWTARSSQKWSSWWQSCTRQSCRRTPQCCTPPGLWCSNPCPCRPRPSHSCGSPSRRHAHSGRSSCRTCSSCRWGTPSESRPRTWPGRCHCGRRGRHRERPRNCCTGSTSVPLLSRQGRGRVTGQRGALFWSSW